MKKTKSTFGKTPWVFCRISIKDRVSDADAPMRSPAHTCRDEVGLIQCLAAIDRTSVKIAVQMGCEFFFQFAFVVLPLDKRHSVKFVSTKLSVNILNISIPLLSFY